VCHSPGPITSYAASLEHPLDRHRIEFIFVHLRLSPDQHAGNVILSLHLRISLSRVERSRRVSLHRYGANTVWSSESLWAENLNGWKVRRFWIISPAHPLVRAHSTKKKKKKREKPSTPNWQRRETETLIGPSRPVANWIMRRITWGCVRCGSSLGRGVIQFLQRDFIIIERLPYLNKSSRIQQHDALSHFSRTRFSPGRNMKRNKLLLCDNTAGSIRTNGLSYASCLFFEIGETRWGFFRGGDLSPC
jgi:hypothetical protein